MSDDTLRPTVMGEALAMLEGRRSVGMTALTAPGPTPEEVRRMLAIAARVPDHAVLEPWRIILIEGEARGEAGALLGEAYRTGNPGMEEARREKFAGIMTRLFTHAPLVVIVVSRPNTATAIPPFEQELSAGAVCMNLLHAAHALGYGATWVTGWAAMNAEATRILGLEGEERVAGIIHVGTAKEVPPDRKRPDLDALVRRWTPPAA